MLRVYWSATSVTAKSLNKPQILARDLETAVDLERALKLEREVWGFGDADVTPLALAIALKASGALFIGAFEGEDLIGYTCAFPSLHPGQNGFHSHILAVRSSHRDLGIGFRLKLEQRKRVLGLAIPEITWTFDPLRSRNAHLNFAKLGVISETYKIDFYGSRSSSPLHRSGTDRLWVRWKVADRRVEERLGGRDPRVEVFDALAHLEPLVAFNADGRPVKSDLVEALARRRIAIEIPGDMEAIESKDLDLARQWRLATRGAFLEALRAGFVVTEFCRSIRGNQGPGAYLLEKKD